LQIPDVIEVIDSHTEGEPTRVVVDGWPPCPGDSMEARRAYFRQFHDHLRRALVCEPRGHDAIVGAVLMPPTEPDSVAGVLFFNNVDTLGMCGHGLIGVVKTLEHLGRLPTGEIRIDTPVGTVGARLDSDGAVTIRNVPARCGRLDVDLEVPGLGKVTGDVAWGGNWFFLTSLPAPPLQLEHLPELLSVTQRMRNALDQLDPLEGDGLIDHVELFGPPENPETDGRNFVLCPGGQYDRSPCGTGTSAKLAVLHARGELALNQPWRQESITGGLFEGWLTEENGELIPHIRGRAWITARSELVFELNDPLRGGFSAATH
jgi:4-hydroxyproline epimerase